MAIKEFHLFAGIGGGIYGGQLLGHKCCGSVEIDDFCNSVLEQRQKDAPNGNPIKYSALSGEGFPKTLTKFLQPSCFIIEGAE